MKKKTLIILVIIAIIVVYYFSQNETEEDNKKKNNGTKGTQNAIDPKVQEISDLLDKFVKTCNDHGGIWNPAAAAKHCWDTATLYQILALDDNTLKAMNTYFLKYKSQECIYPENYSSTKKRQRTSLSDAIPSGTLCKYRTDASIAFAFKNKMKAKGF
ncbi:MAG: hypothetical protein ACI30A_06715 [Paludibacteraceae bacterium]